MATNTKIVLKNTTKMTLNERFTAYRTQALANNSSYRTKIQMQRQASSANLRLAQQMANRPTVIAALRIKKRSLQQRLGRKQSANGSIKSRLSFGGKRLYNRPVQGRLGNVRGRGMARRGGFKSGVSPLIKERLGLPKGGFKKMQTTNQRGGFRNRRGGNFRGNRQGRGGGNRQQNKRNNMGNARGRGRGGNQGWWNNKSTGNMPTKQELDNQLDEYMAETKSSLDAQLGQYMAQG